MTEIKDQRFAPLVVFFIIKSCSSCNIRNLSSIYNGYYNRDYNETHELVYAVGKGVRRRVFFELP